MLPLREVVLEDEGDAGEEEDPSMAGTPRVRLLLLLLVLLSFPPRANDAAVADGGVTWVDEAAEEPEQFFLHRCWR